MVKKVERKLTTMQDIYALGITGEDFARVLTRIVAQSKEGPKLRVEAIAAVTEGAFAHAAKLRLNSMETLIAFQSAAQMVGASMITKEGMENIKAEFVRKMPAWSPEVG